MKTEVIEKYKLDLSQYEVKTNRPKVDDNKKVIIDENKWPIMESIVYPLRENLSDWLRTAGMFENAAQLVDAVMLAKEIRKATAEFLILDEKEAAILRAVLDKLIKMTADGKAQLGGIIHEEAICRIVNMEKITG